MILVTAIRPILPAEVVPYQKSNVPGLSFNVRRTRRLAGENTMIVLMATNLITRFVPE